MRQVVDDALAGVNSCVMAYGPTGTGKTHTMLGPPPVLSNAAEAGMQFSTLRKTCSLKGMLYVVVQHAGAQALLEEHGLIPRIVFDLCERKPVTTSITCSYMEIYNDQIIDLLDQRDSRMKGRRQRAKLAVWEDGDGVAHVRNVQQQRIESLADVVRLLRIGAQQRSVRQTALNQHSSRGHTILQLLVEARQCAQDPHVVRSKINLVDLAGSEPHPGGPVTADSHAAETRAINISLSALVSVVSALASGSSHLHVPYRDSKLTTVLKDSLGGNCCTYVIATLSTSASAYQETHSTLQFANRAAAIVNNVTRNECNDVGSVLAAKDEEIYRLRAMIQQLSMKAASYNVTKQHADPQHLQQSISDLKVCTPSSCSSTGVT